MRMRGNKFRISNLKESVNYMSLYEDAYDAIDNSYKENYEKNMEYFNSLSDNEKFKLLWDEYVNNHCHDILF